MPQSAIVQGLRDAGYVYMNLDCGTPLHDHWCRPTSCFKEPLVYSGWTTGKRERGPNGRLQVNTAKFPNMTDYSARLHKLGMKFGMCECWWLPLGCPGVITP